MRTWILILLPIVILALAAQSDEQPAIQDNSAFHPPVKLLNTDGASVYSAGGAVSPMLTCGQCHDTQYIAAHSFHVDAGQAELTSGGSFLGARPWDFGPGLFGRWDPLTYTLPLTAGGLDRSAWVKALGFLHAGGGPAFQTGSEAAEMNCFLCHTAKPDNAARIGELQAGRFGWAATATLGGTGLTQRGTAGWQWNHSLFASDGTISPANLTLGAPTSVNCGLCHGIADAGDKPVQLDYNLSNWSTETTGQVFSSQRVSASALNLQDKDRQVRPWDIHAESLLDCADCHYSLNNPAYSREPEHTKPNHLLFDPRKLSLGKYLKAPSHSMAKGVSAQGLVAADTDGSMRRCVDCHDAQQTHKSWLPYARRHLRALSCEACHVPRIYAPARRVTDWTVLTLQGGPSLQYRGGASGALSEASLKDAQTLLAGYQPVLMPRREPDGRQQLVPYNVIVSWYWAGVVPGGSGETRPVGKEQLRQAFLPNGKYAPELLAALDGDHDGALSDSELRLDTPEKKQAAQALLVKAGVANPRIMCEMAPYDLHHGVATAQWAVRGCKECHAKASRMSMPLALSDYDPGGIPPELVADTSVQFAGRMVQAGGNLSYQPLNAMAGIYVLGHDRWVLGDRLGLVAILLALLAVLSHGLLRIGLAVRGRKRGVR